MAGTTGLKEVVKGVLVFGNGLGKALEDGKITVGDTQHLIPVLLEIPSVLGSLDAAGEEITDLTPEEIAELAEFAKATFDIPQDDVEEKIEEALSLAISIYNFVASFGTPEEAPDA